MNRLPDGPLAPSWWQLTRWIADPLRYLDECSERYGEVFTLRLAGFPPWVIVARPEAIEEIFSIDAKAFNTAKGNAIALPLLGENSLLLLDGDRHKRERKLLMPAFHGDNVRVYSRIIVDATARVMERWGERAIVDIRSATRDITIEVILQAVFGLRDGDRYRELKPLLAEMLDSTNSPLRSIFFFYKNLQRDWGAWSPWGRMLRRRERIYSLLQEEIDARRASGSLGGQDVLSLMMAVGDESGEPMSDAELKHELVTLLIAGHETTATTLTWALYNIARETTIAARIVGEIGDNTDPMALSRLPYLTAVCNETLRLYPVIPVTFTRSPRGEISVAGYHFDETVGLSPCIYLVHRRATIYPEPTRFNPDRFLDRTYSPNEFFPFGGGSRRCLGYALAMLELKLVVGAIVSRYHLDLSDRRVVKPGRRGLTLAPSGNVNLQVSKREESRTLVPART
jgi:cytochrome P450